jgi:peroxiredoxin
MQKVVIFLLALTLFSCNDNSIEKIPSGTYRGWFEIEDKLQIPFNFEMGTKDDGQQVMKIFNAEEEIETSLISYKNDSVYINFPVYEGYLVADVYSESLSGYYVKESLNRVVPFRAEGHENQRFVNPKNAITDVSGVWEMLFTEDDGRTFIARGNFKQDGNKVTGNIRTTTGDYRYLEGVVDGNVLKYSVFDGAHAFLFTAEVTNDQMTNGTFYSGNHYKARYEAKRNTAYQLPDENSLTFLKEGYDAIAFTFPDANGNMVSLSDERFKDKVVLVQIMGTWCPNCLDESKYYAEQYKTLKNQGVEIIALAFEYAKTEAKAFAGIKRLQNTVGIDYPILLAQYGSSSKQLANEKLPMLNHVLSYPTTIFVDKQGVVRKIHTGFNGPATGDKYLSFQKEFAEFVGRLLSE